jgi:hypothetical protein
LIHKHLIVLLVFVSFISCNSERTQCLKDKRVYSPTSSGDPKCDAAGLLVVVATDRRNPSNTNFEAINAALLVCLNSQLAIQECNKKSDIIPATW